MSGPTWLPKWLGGSPRRTTSAVVGSRMLRAADDHSADTPQNARYWRRLGASQPNRNLMEIDHKRMVEECASASQTDGMARSHVRLVTSITVGSQEIVPTYECKNEAARDRLNELLNRFWCDPSNDFECELSSLMSGLTTTGSLCLTAHTGAGSRLTRVGYVDPATFVTPGVLQDPSNVRRPIAVLRASWTNANEVVAHPILGEDDTVFDVFAGQPEGAMVSIFRADQFGGPIDVRVGAPCWYLGVNRMAPNQSCGISDLYPALDLMRLQDELVFGAVERSINLGAYSLHVKFPRGTTADDISIRMNAIREDLESGKGRAVGTTDDVQITAIAAALQAGEWATLETVARTNALIALGPWPVHIFSEGAGTNVTAAAEQGSAVANFLLDRQNVFRKLWLRICRYAVRQYPEGEAMLAANPDAKIVFPFPLIVAKNTTRESNVLSVEANVLSMAEDRGWITTEAAQREFSDSAKRYGFDLTADDIPDEDEIAEMRSIRTLSLPPLMPDVPAEGEGDPRGGHRDGEDAKVAEGTPTAGARRKRARR